MTANNLFSVLGGDEAIANSERWRCILAHPRALPYAQVRAQGLSSVPFAMHLESTAAVVGSRTEAARKILARERSGELKLIFATEPGGAPSDYVSTMERLWDAQGEHFDFVGADTANARFQEFKRDLYLVRLGAVFSRLPPGALVLDAGCGVGRFAAVWQQRHWYVTYVDASLKALCAAARAALDAGTAWDEAAFVHARLDDLAAFPTASFDAVFAFEVLSYMNDPAAGLAELVRVAKPGAVVVVSLEGAWGALAASERVGITDIDQVLAGCLLQPGELVVHYTDADSLARQLTAAGLIVEAVYGTHYVADGILGRLALQADLQDVNVRKRLVNLDLRCAQDKAVCAAARAWLATARKPGGEEA